MNEHTDFHATMSNYTEPDRVNSFHSFNSSATEDVRISGSELTRPEIELQKPLLVAMARENWSEFGGEPNGDGNVDAIFDEALCDDAELSLEIVGFDVEDLPLYKFRALLVKQARGISSFEDLASYINDYSHSELDQFGLKQALGQSSYRKLAKSLMNNDQFEALCDAAFVSVHALFWNGVPIPSRVEDQYDLSRQDGPAASDFSDAARKLALYNLIGDLLDIVVENLDLKRSENKSRSLRSLMGVFAQAAYSGESIEKYQQIASHEFDLENALAGSTIRGHIDKLKLYEVHEMFDDISTALLEYAINSEAITEPAIVSYDLTDIRNHLNHDAATQFLTKDGRWRFASLAFTDSAFEFSFGVRLLSSEAQRARLLRRLLRDLTNMVDVKLFLADRGFDGKEDIEVCRELTDCWLIHAQDDSNIADDSDFERLKEKMDPGEPDYISNAGPEGLHPPVDLIGYSGKGENPESLDPSRFFFGDYDALENVAVEKDTGDLIAGFNFRYNQRAKMETMFRLAKNKLDVETDSAKPVRKLFYFNISILFYNLYQLADTLPSPRAGLEIETKQNEVLSIIRNLAFEGPTPPEALTYHREHFG